VNVRHLVWQISKGTNRSIGNLCIFYFTKEYNPLLLGCFLIQKAEQPMGYRLLWFLRIMIDINRLRKIDPELKDLSNKEIIVIREYLYNLGNFIFEGWHEQKFGSKYPAGDKHGKRNDNKI
jgi:hypothetical protein